MAIDERGVNLKVTATNETQQGFEGVKQSAREMANTVTQESGRASQSVGKIGDGGQQASQKVERATRSMIQSIQRTTAAMEAGSRTSAKYYETLAQQRGVDPEALRPYLNQLEEVRRKQEQASTALGAGAIEFNKYGMSAKQTAAALRGVPAQITDIVVSLQGGQRPMTVLLQQGGQLRDLFGGIVPAARALGSTLLGMVNPLTLAAAAVGGLYMAYRTGAAEAERFHASLVLTGNAAGTSVDQLMTMASRIDSVASTQRRAASALNEFVSSSRVGVRNLEEFTLAAIKWEDATGTAISETVKQFEELARAPLEASTKLDQALGHLTGSLRDQIRELEEQGRMIDAANLAQKAFADTINERAPQIVQQIGYIEKGWRAVKSAISEAVDAMAGIGRPQTTFEQLIDAETRLQQLQDGAAERGAVRRQRQIAEQEAIVASLRGQYAVEQSILTLQQQGAEERARQQERERNLREYLGEPDRMTRAQQMQKDLEEERKIYEARKKDAAGNAQALQQIEQAHQVALKNIRERYKEKAGSGGISTTQTELARLNALLEAERQREEALHSLGLAQANLNEGEKLAIQYAEKLKLATDEKTKAQLTANKALAEEYGARKRANDVFEKDLKDRQSAIDAAKRQTERLRDEIETYGMGKSAIEAMTIARLEEKLAIDSSLTGDQRHLELLRQEIEERQKLLGAMRTKEALDAQLKEWQNWEREVDRIFDQLGQSLTDQLFEGGKSARDMLKDLFKNLVLRVAIQPMLSGLQGMVTNQIGGLLGYQDPRQQSSSSSLDNLMTGNSSMLSKGIGWLGEKFGSTALQSFSQGMAGTAASFGQSFALSSALPATASWAGAAAGLAPMMTPAAAAGLSIGPGVAASLGTGAAGTVGAGTAAAAAAPGIAGLGSAFATALPYVGIGLAAASAFGLFDSGPPKTRHGQRTTIDYAGGAYGISAIDDRQAAGSEQAALAAAQSAVAAANDLFARIGVNAGIESFYAIMESSVLGDRNGVASGGMLRIGDQLRQIGIKQSGDMTFAGVGGWSSEDMLSRLQTDITLTTLEAFQALGDQLPSVLSNMLAGIDFRNISAETAQDLATRFAAVADGATQFLAAIETMPFEQLRDLSFDAAAGMVQFAGGVENLLSAQQTYYERFYSDAERHGHAVDQLTQALARVGVEMPELVGSTDQMLASYRAIVEAQDLNTEAGRQVYVALMQASGAFAEVAQYAGQAARERERLETQLLQVQGNTTELRRRELAALDESNRALQLQIWALQDQADAAQRAAERLRDASQIAAQAMAASWSQLGTASGWAAQHLGDTSGLSAQLSAMRRAFSGTTDLAAREAALGKIIGLEQAIWQAGQANRQAEVRAAQQQAQALQQQLSAANALVSAAQRLRGYAESLWFGEDSGLSDTERMGALAAQYQTLLGRARAGDAEAMGQLQGATSDYLRLAQQLSGSQADYSVLSGRIAAELESTAVIQEASAVSQARMLEAQIEATRSMVEGMDRQFEVSDATKALIAKQLEDAEKQFQEQQKRLQKQIEQGDISIGLLDGLPIELTGVLNATLVPAISSIASAAMAAASMAASASEAARLAADRAAGGAQGSTSKALAGMKGIPGFADGGFHAGGLRFVGERGIELEATGPSRIYSNSQTADILRRAMSGGGNAELIAEVRALREQNARLEGRLASIERSTGQFARQFAHLTMDGSEMLIRDVKTLEEEPA